MSKKYRFFLAAVTFQFNRVDGDRYTLIKIEDGTYVKTEDTFRSQDEALAAAIDSEGAKDVLREINLVPSPRVRTAMFASHAEAMKWIEAQRESVGGNTNFSHFDWIVDEQTLEESEVEEAEHSPTYEVVLEIKTTKHVTVEIGPDHDRYDECEDEFDACDLAQNIFEMGDLDGDVEYADVWDTEVEVYSSTEW